MNNFKSAHAQVPATETSITEVPATDTPAPGAPATDTPAPGTPATEVPATETPGVGTVISPLPQFVNSIVFNKSSPTNGANIHDDGTHTVQLVWTDAGIDTTTDKYEYCIDEINNNLCDTTWNARKSLHSGPGDVVVLPGHTYYWQVRTQNAQTQADSGVWWSLTIIPATVTITGNVGIGLATISFTGGAPFLSNLDGSYSITVAGGYTGTVAPSKTGYVFSPAFRSYTNLATNQVNQNYTALLTISGNTGVNATTVVFIDGGSQTATSDTKGNYSIAVPIGWTGTVTPLQVCSTFTPTNRSYSNVTIAQTAQNYTYTVNGGCANIAASIGGINQGTYNLPPGESVRQNYSGVDNGPVKVQSLNSVPIIAAERDAFSVGTTITSFAQFMGLPAGQLSDTYYFPAYNNVTLNEQLRIGNVDTVDSTVSVSIGGVVHGPYLIHPNGSLRVNYAGVDSGPVVVEGTTGVHIIAAERDAWTAGAPYNTVTSFSQLMGLPGSQLSDTYLFPAYNNVTLNEQLRIGNVDTVDSTVAVSIGGVAHGPYLLHPSDSIRLNFAGVDSGPVIVQGTPGVHIIAAERDAWSTNGTPAGTTSFTQLMGLPASQLSDTYQFPAYNNITLNEQLRIANVDSVPSTVTVTIGGVLQATYLLAANGSVRVNYAGLDSGPVVVHGTSGVHIIAAERDAWATGTTITSFVQLMGLPAGSLSDTYLFPAYNNVTLNEQLRFGVP